MYVTDRSPWRVKGSFGSLGVIQNPYALSRCSGRNHMPSFPNYIKRSHQDMVQQIDTQLHQYLQRAKYAVCIALHRGHKYKKSITCLMSIKQWEDKTLRSYITRFNKEALSIDEADDKILVAAFTNGLRKGSFCSLYTKMTQRPC